MGKSSAYIIGDTDGDYSATIQVVRSAAETYKIIVSIGTYIDVISLTSSKEMIERLYGLQHIHFGKMVSNTDAVALAIELSGLDIVHES